MLITNLVFILLCLKPWILEAAAANLLEDVAKRGINVRQPQEQENWILLSKDLEILMLKTERLQRQMAEVLRNIQKVTESGRLKGLNQCRCPSNYTWHSPLNLCFRLSKEMQTWEAASQICESEGGHLAKVNTTEIQQYLKEQIKNSGYHSLVFIGGNDKEKEGVWKWADSELIDMKSALWYPGDPDGKDIQNCLLMYGAADYRLIDAQCSLESYYICQIG